jgi:hypothetical protein
MTPRCHAMVLLVALSACAADDTGPPPLAVVQGKLGRIAVNTTSMFAIDTTDNSLVELGLDGSMIGKLPTAGAVSDVAAAGDLVAWVEAEGTNKHVKRRKAGVVETLPTFTPHIVVTADGVFYSDAGLIASWSDAVPTRIATPAAGAALIGIDTAYAYTVEAGMSVVRYDLRMDMSEAVLPTAMSATVSAGLLAYRTADGVRIHDLFTKFDAVIGTPPADYACDLLIAGNAVMCGKYRELNGASDELLTDPVTGYTAIGRDVYWVTQSGAKSEIRTIDAEQKLK